MKVLPMASFGWKRKIGEKVSRATSQQFEAEAADEKSPGSDEDEDWVHATKRRKEVLLEDCIKKSKQLKDEGASLAENRRKSGPPACPGRAPTGSWCSLCSGPQREHYCKWNLMGAKLRRRISSLALLITFFFITAQDIIHCLGCKCMLLALVEFFIHHNCPELLYPLIAHPTCMFGSARWIQLHSFACGLVELHEVCRGLPLMSFKIPWLASPPNVSAVSLSLVSSTSLLKVHDQRICFSHKRRLTHIIFCSFFFCQPLVGAL
ncbi:tetratricopeptide repeat protein 33 isoform X2 [Tympanuchus pallidicinctus]|uniref:tetratricopeptide repeat protein 33 isoform X2 n=1 Tax=Tympanuchus pallidicinctus TaxID=109042 RepID=UPI00228761D9|nr:tetratricopeptide repeat protein 33 isoform X2 [Tympanuchus pallidicinctus]